MSNCFCYYNQNPQHKRVGDCVVRAISIAILKDWEYVYAGLVSMGFMMSDIPTSNAVWGAYLKRKGWSRRMVNDGGQESYTVSDFCDSNKHGTFILGLSGHLTCVRNGIVYDTWDCSDEVPIYYWVKEKR